MHEKNRGYIHSIQTLGTLDGPGLRTVVFFQGCSLRCKFCHNADTIIAKAGTLREVESLASEILKNKAYWSNSKENAKSAAKTMTDGNKTDKSKPCRKFVQDRETKVIAEPPTKVKGGVTFSGGDPLFQPGFALSLAKELKYKHPSTHIALDTNVNVSQKVIDSIIDYVDLWMISIKHMNNERHKQLTNASNKKILENIKYIDTLLYKKNMLKALRIRFVVIPTITDNPELIKELVNFVKQLKSLELVEILPYTSMGKDKWIKLKGSYDLEGVPDAGKKDVAPVKKAFQEAEIKVIC
jgi:pyruvate formate lyase activating enzyme